MTQVSKTLFLTLAALVCLLSTGAIARAGGSTGGVVNNGSLNVCGGIVNVASGSFGIVASNGTALFLSNLSLDGSIGSGCSFTLVETVPFTFQAGSLDNLIALNSTSGTLGGSEIINSGTFIIPEPATWLLTGLGLLLFLRTHRSRRRPV